MSFCPPGVAMCQEARRRREDKLVDTAIAAAEVSHQTPRGRSLHSCGVHTPGISRRNEESPQKWWSSRRVRCSARALSLRRHSLNWSHRAITARLHPPTPSLSSPLPSLSVQAAAERTAAAEARAVRAAAMREEALETRRVAAIAGLAAKEARDRENREAAAASFKSYMRQHKGAQGVDKLCVSTSLSLSLRPFPFPFPTLKLLRLHLISKSPVTVPTHRRSTRTPHAL